MQAVHYQPKGDTPGKCGHLPAVTLGAGEGFQRLRVEVHFENLLMLCDIENVTKY